MFGLGFWELVMIAVVALLFIGPDRLPKFFRALGRATREFQKASRELRENLAIDEPPPSYRPVRRPPAVRPRHVPSEVPAPREPAPAVPVAAVAPEPPPVAETPAAAVAPAEPSAASPPGDGSGEKV